MIKKVFGCDPEFRLMKQDSCADASSALPGNNVAGGWIGHDGASSTGELRPGISKNDWERLFLVIYAALEKIHQNGYLVYGGAYKCSAPIGGHIHLSLEAEGLNKEMLDEIPKTTSSIIHAMSIVIMNENLISETYHRRKHGYGGVKTFNTQGALHWEFREPWSWIIDPNLTRYFFAVLDFASSVALRGRGSYEVEKEITENGLKKFIKRNLSKDEVSKNTFKIIENITNTVNNLIKINYEMPANFYWKFPVDVNYYFLNNK